MYGFFWPFAPPLFFYSTLKALETYFLNQLLIMSYGPFIKTKCSAKDKQFWLFQLRGFCVTHISVHRQEQQKHDLNWISWQLFVFDTLLADFVTVKGNKSYTLTRQPITDIRKHAWMRNSVNWANVTASLFPQLSLALARLASSGPNWELAATGSVGACIPSKGPLPS